MISAADAGLIVRRPRWPAFGFMNTPSRDNVKNGRHERLPSRISNSAAPHGASTPPPTCRQQPPRLLPLREKLERVFDPIELLRSRRHAHGARREMVEHSRLPDVPSGF